MKRYMVADLPTLHNLLQFWSLIPVFDTIDTTYNRSHSVADVNRGIEHESCGNSG